MRASKVEARYRHGVAPINCGHCAMYVRPSGCASVRGEIKPQDLCDYFQMDSQSEPVRAERDRA